MKTFKKGVVLDAKTIGLKALETLKEVANFCFYETTLPAEVIERSIDAEIIVLNKIVMTKEILMKLPRLKLICITATGMDNVDVKSAKELGIEVKNVSAYSTESVAQHTLACALSLLGRLNYYDSYCKSGAYSQSDIFTHVGGKMGLVEGCQWGIIGLGNIGKRVASLAQAFKAKVVYSSTRDKKEGYERLSLENLLKTSDIISIHAPLNESTHNLIALKELKSLKQGAILINMGRGGIVNEKDLAQVLETRDLYYASDVFVKEPLEKGHAFLNPKIQNKLLLTPHIAWAYSNSLKVLVEKTKENIQVFLEQNA
ncbi:D-2-hydroxyacid dehydrogenase [Helicobacter cetorum]|uniref:2-hydroxyacid dehydrogenase n=1 Tax=Helicobacter cetorum (strain ATCC BAA-540 / CCUG 52418 / MIT 99-5656) TaxID=1163745 RepID=I0ERZ6_HELCM|nr:D-2-hydroxyacid dehydrogenase [Helicobacter cetorum]AFI05715.1 2-hydroxyacid dehydrogenase [Helicobacter cetorum MIT 99-5656]